MFGIFLGSVGRQTFVWKRYKNPLKSLISHLASKEYAPKTLALGQKFYLSACSYDFLTERLLMGRKESNQSINQL